jgi:hypothetical protein
LRCRRGGGDEAANAVHAVGDRDSELELAVELVRQGQRGAFGRFEQARWATVHLQDVDRDVEFLQVLFERAVLVASPLQPHVGVFERAVMAEALDEHPEALARVLDHEGGARLEALVTGAQGG